MKKLNDYIQVTRKNMRMALQPGDQFYIIRQVSEHFEITGHGDIRPRLRPGIWIITGMPHGINNYVNFEIIIKQEESPQEYHEKFSPIFVLVDEGVVYVRKTDKRRTTYTLKGETPRATPQPKPQEPPSQDHQTDIFA